MKIVMFYHSLVSDWNHGNAHFLRGVASELVARGHVEPDAYERQQHRDMPDPEWARVVIYGPNAGSGRHSWPDRVNKWPNCSNASLWRTPAGWAKLPAVAF